MKYHSIEFLQIVSDSKATPYFNLEWSSCALMASIVENCQHHLKTMQ